VAKEAERGLKTMERALGGPTFCWAGKNYPCSPGKNDELKVLGEGGFAPEWTIALNVRTSVLPEPGPGLRQSFTYRGHTYRVAHLEPSADGAWVKIVGVDADQGI